MRYRNRAGRLAARFAVPAAAADAELLVALTPWYRNREALRLIGFRYLPWLVGLNRACEIAQRPLYTLWREAPAA